MEKRLIELLTRKMAGELSSSELVELNEILSVYPEAHQEEAIFKQIWDSKVLPEDVNFLYEQHKKKYGDALLFNELSDTSPATMKWKKHHKYLAAAGILMIASFLIYFVYDPLPDPDSYKQIIVGKGVRKKVLLPDGTNVWLNADSKLSYDPKMNNADMRLVTLEGEAFFDVVHDKKHPFIIKTNKVSIRVLGTSFNIRAYTNDKKCETTLIRGSVELTLTDDSKQKIILKSSEKFGLIEEDEQKDLKKENTPSQGKTLLIEHIDPVMVEDKEYVPEISWTENRIMFKNETLQEIAVRLERWYNVKIAIDNKEIGSYHFTGSFTNETIDQVLTAMRLIKSFNFKINNNDITIY